MKFPRVASVTDFLNERLTRLFTRLNDDLSEYPSEQLDLAIWSSTTLCGQSWLRAATDSDKAQLLAQNRIRRMLGSDNALCGRCSR